MPLSYCSGFVYTSNFHPGVNHIIYAKVGRFTKKYSFNVFCFHLLGKKKRLSGRFVAKSGKLSGGSRCIIYWPPGDKCSKFQKVLSMPKFGIIPIWRYRLMVRTLGSHPSNSGSTPDSVTSTFVIIPSNDRKNARSFCSLTSLENLSY